VDKPIESLFTTPVKGQERVNGIAENNQTDLKKTIQEKKILQKKKKTDS
jgi:hypothetical protein